MMGNWILIIFVILAPGQPTMVYKVTGNYDFDTCRGKGQTLVQEALQSYPSATVTSACYQMVPQ